MYCLGKTVLWVNFAILTCLLGFLLWLHCILYKRVNGKCSLRVFKRIRVATLTLSVLLTGCMFIKMTFMMNYADLVLLILSQLLRFLIWSLTLMNFMKSAASLTVSPRIKVAIKLLKGVIVIGLLVYIGYAFTLGVIAQTTDRQILSCHSREFIIQNTFMVILLLVFIYYASLVTKEIN